MSDGTRRRLHDTVAAHLAEQAEEARAAAAEGRDPEPPDRSSMEAAALAHLDGSPGHDELRAAYEDGPDDQAAADALAAHRMAARIAEGRPVTPTVGS